MLPISGFQVLASVGLSHVLKRNKYAAAIAVFNTNLYTGLLLFYLNFKFGGFILGIKSVFQIPDKLDSGDKQSSGKIFDLLKYPVILIPKAEKNFVDVDDVVKTIIPLNLILGK